MKTPRKTLNPLLNPTLALVILAQAGLPAVSLAQKGAEKLMRPWRTQTGEGLQRAATGDQPAAACCPKCTDSWVTVVEKSFKAVQPEIKRRVLRHDCPDCADIIVTEGHGKAKTRKVVHLCGDSRSKDAPCCEATQRRNTP